MKSTIVGIYLCILSFLSYSQDTLNIFFAHNSDKIGNINRNVLKHKLNNKNNLQISEIIGFASEPGTTMYNKKLAGKRIHSTLEIIKNLLLIDTMSIKKTAFGEVQKSSPMESLDRRVSIIFTHDGEKMDLKKSINSKKIGENLTLNNINFEPGLDIVLSQSMTTLDALFSTLKENKKLKIQIEGHICCQYEDENNLSRARAKTIYDYLVSKGIEKERLSYVGFGSKRPLYPLPEKNAFEEISNRRVEIKIIDK